MLLVRLDPLDLLDQEWVSSALMLSIPSTSLVKIKKDSCFFLNERETKAPLVSRELLDLLAQLDPVDHLAPLATTDLRCVLSRARKQ